LAHLPEHLLKAGRKEDLNNLLFDYVWLQVKLDRLGIQALLEDFRLSQLSADDATLQLGRALEQGAYVLAKDLTQLAAQLLGRLVGDEDEQMQRLFTKARQRCSRPCLLPQTASLRQEYALLRTLAGHKDLVTGVVVTPDGGRAISSSWDKTLKVWDLASGQELLTLSGHTDLVTDVAVTPDGSRAISSSYDNTLKVWDLASGSCFATFHADGSLRVCAVSLDGSIVATAGESGRVHFLRLEE
jgi:WD40 repeat protein